MGLVRDVHQKRVNQQVVKAILELGAGVDATVIAEGIETREEAAALQDLGLRYGQGYLFGRPRDPMVGPVFCLSDRLLRASVSPRPVRYPDWMQRIPS